MEYHRHVLHRRERVDDDAEEAVVAAHGDVVEDGSTAKARRVAPLASVCVVRDEGVRLVQLDQELVRLLLVGDERDGERVQRLG